MPSFYFEQLLQNGLNGIDQQGITGAVLQIAGVVLDPESAVGSL